MQAKGTVSPDIQSDQLYSSVKPLPSHQGRFSQFTVKEISLDKKTEDQVKYYQPSEYHADITSRHVTSKYGFMIKTNEEPEFYSRKISYKPITIDEDYIPSPEDVGRGHIPSCAIGAALISMASREESRKVLQQMITITKDRALVCLWDQEGRPVVIDCMATCPRESNFPCNSEASMDANWSQLIKKAIVIFYSYKNEQPLDYKLLREHHVSDIYAFLTGHKGILRHFIEKYLPSNKWLQLSSFENAWMLHDLFHPEQKQEYGLVDRSASAHTDTDLYGINFSKKQRRNYIIKIVFKGKPELHKQWNAWANKNCLLEHFDDLMNTGSQSYVHVYWSTLLQKKCPAELATCFLDFIIEHFEQSFNKIQIYENNNKSVLEHYKNLTATAWTIIHDNGTTQNRLVAIGSRWDINYSITGITPNHAYAVLGTFEDKNGKKYLTLKSSDKLDRPLFSNVTNSYIGILRNASTFTLPLNHIGLFDHIYLSGKIA